MRVVAVRPRGAPRLPPPEMPERAVGSEPSAFPSTPVHFSELGLPPGILEAVLSMGYQVATQVQAEAIPRARTGRDLIVQSRTGTGKTAAFGIPIVERADSSLSETQALVLCPTRELCLQVTGDLKRLGAPSGIRVLAIYGGDPMPRQVDGLRAGAHVVVGTPGRLLDHLRQGTLRLDRVKTLVLDEADQMLDMGFEKEMKQILERVPKERQTLMFSATIPSSIEAMASRYQKDPERLMLSHDSLYVSDVLHLFYIVARMDKAESLYKLIEYEDPASSMIFCNTQAETRAVHLHLAKRGLPVAMISSDLPQKKREQVMRRFRNKELKHLVATDVAARGIDIEDLSHVFIYSAPVSTDQYIHRAGRTGRIGKSGKAISLVSGFDLMNFNRLVRANNLKAYECDVPSDEEVARKKVRRIVKTLKDLTARLTPEDRAEYQDMAQGILDDADRVAIVSYLLRTHFEEQAQKTILDESLGEDQESKPSGPAASSHQARAHHGTGSHGRGGAAPAAGAGGAEGQRRRRRRRRGGGGSGSSGGGGGHRPAS
jgi:ATP-dependent RNA helicase DeaD